MLVLAAPVLQAPDDPGSRGLWGLVALILLVALVAAQVRVLRAVARQLDEDPGGAEEPSGSSAGADPQVIEAEPGNGPR